jgi:hypothetical protein
VWIAPQPCQQFKLHDGGIMRITTLMAALLLIGGSALADEPQSTGTTNEAPSATLSLNGTSLAAGVGWVWGEGKLEFKGQEHPFKISGLSIVDAGVANISADGEVYNLKRLSDFAGKYTVASAGVAVVEGAGASYLKNEHGVVIKLLESSQGFRANLAAQGVTIRLKS